MKTEYFTNCVAAFEGGGVRGAAYAGAYKAAFDAGIRFSRVAGSSAGSVAAAFIAAGGTPDVIAAELLKTDLSMLQSPVTDKDVPFSKSTLIGRILRGLPSGTSKKIGQIVCYSGIYGSSAVRQWVEETLRELLKATGFRAEDRPIRFSDLKIPLYVVAADVLQKGPKVWSLEATPEDSVALAVQASCALPFYFQPVTSGQSVFIDGGVISNLPSYVFSRRQGHPGRFAEKTLAFRLKADHLSTLRSRFSDFMDYSFGIADALVSAATSIQQSLQEDVYTIEISTGDIESTDFDKMTTAKKNMLFENGVTAVSNFVAREREIIGQYKVTSLYRGFDERLLAYVYAISEAKNTVWFSDSSTY